MALLLSLVAPSSVNSYLLLPDRLTQQRVSRWAAALLVALKLCQMSARPSRRQRLLPALQQVRLGSILLTWEVSRFRADLGGLILRFRHQGQVPLLCGSWSGLVLLLRKEIVLFYMISQERPIWNQPLPAQYNILMQLQRSVRFRTFTI